MLAAITASDAPCCRLLGERSRRHTPEQVIRKLAEADKLLAEGKTVEEACRHLEITESTYHRLIRASSGALY